MTNIFCPLFIWNSNLMLQLYIHLICFEFISRLIANFSEPKLNSRPSKMAGIRTDNASEYFVL